MITKAVLVIIRNLFIFCERVLDSHRGTGKVSLAKLGWLLNFREGPHNFSPGPIFPVSSTIKQRKFNLSFSLKGGHRDGEKNLFLDLPKSDSSICWIMKTWTPWEALSSPHFILESLEYVQPHTTNSSDVHWDNALCQMHSCTELNCTATIQRVKFSIRNYQGSTLSSLLFFLVMDIFIRGI